MGNALMQPSESEVYFDKLHHCKAVGVLACKHPCQAHRAHSVLAVHDACEDTLCLCQMHLFLLLCPICVHQKIFSNLEWIQCPYYQVLDKQFSTAICWHLLVCISALFHFHLSELQNCTIRI